jgi:hypothetical protein
MMLLATLVLALAAAQVCAAALVAIGAFVVRSLR